MARTGFRTGKRKDIFLYRTQVENLFINEFLPDAPGDCVKVFLFGLMYAQFDEEIDSRTMALTLGMSEKDVDNAWKYWESKGLVNIIGTSGEDGYAIEFVRQIDLFYGKTIEESYPVRDKAAQEPGSDAAVEDNAEEGPESIIERLVNQQLRELLEKYQELTGRTISRHEASKFTDAVKLYGIEPDVLDFAIDYCVDIDKYSIDYICKVALRWKEEGSNDVASVKKMLDLRSRRNESYRQVFSALGFARPSTPADREIMNRWFDEMGFSIGEVLDACKAAGGIREPSLRYVNKVLENRMLEKGGINTRSAGGESQQRITQGGQPAQAPGQTGSDAGEARVSRKVLKDYYDHIREEDEKSLAARLGEIRLRVPEIRDIFRAEAELNQAIISMTPGPDARERRQRLRDKRQRLEDDKRELLISRGYPGDYLERKYRCDICRDTGYTDEGRVCVCCRKRAEEAYKWIQETGNR